MIIIPKFAKRCPYYKKGFLFVPRYYFNHGDFQFCLTEIFENNLFNIEFCSGNGKWITDKAIENTNVNWIAVERRFDRAKQIWMKKNKFNLHNLLVVFGEAQDFARFYVKDNQISSIYINFPDPWPKKKHAKHRLVTVDFLKRLNKICIVDGLLTIVSDYSRYLDDIFENALKTSWNCLSKNDYDNLYGNSFFSDLWTKKGKEIKYLKLVNKKCKDFKLEK